LGGRGAIKGKAIRGKAIRGNKEGNQGDSEKGGPRTREGRGRGGCPHYQMS